MTLYHNRGDTTFTGENSQYGDFFGLDDLFTENPRVVDGMIDIYKTWIRDFGVDGFRIDTMKHVNDEFWQRFAPGDRRATRTRRASRDFFMFGEVARGHQPSRSRRTHDPRRRAGRPGLPVPDAAHALRREAGADRPSCASSSPATTGTPTRDSNVYQLPTFLGNHDMGRIGMLRRGATTRAPSDAELLARDRLAHELMYFSRGNPVVYYGDEQGFTGDGGDQDARQDMFAEPGAAYYNDDDLHRHGRHARRGDNFDPIAPAVPRDRAARRGSRRRTRRCATAPSRPLRPDGPGIYAFSRLDRARAARVRRRAQQQRAAADGGDPDLRPRERRLRASTATAPPAARATRGRR